jgi:hypothetical protein
MVLRRIGIDQVNQESDLPWVNDYVRTIGEKGDSSVVTRVVSTDKGFLIVCKDFKGFLFNKSSLHGFLSEALEVWIQNSTVNFPLFGIASATGKLELAVDDEIESSDWIKQNNTWEQRLKKAQGSGYIGVVYNPLLPVPPLTPSNGKKTKSNATPTTTTT